MNKRFSTLLAGVLLAGGTFSVQTVSADEAALLKSLGKYYQVEVATDKYLVIGQGEMRDSLAVWEKADIKTLDQLNETLWSVKFTPVIGSNGQIAEYEMRLFNKVGNRQLILTTSLVEPGKTFHKSPYAVLGSEGIEKWTVTPDEYKGLVGSSDGIKDQDFRFVEYIYSQSADKTTKYRLVVDGSNDKIKLQSIVSEEQKGDEPTFKTDFPSENSVSVLAPTAILYAGSNVDAPVEGQYEFGAEELNKQGNDGFTLAFSNDVVNNKYANPFSAYTLQATEMPIYMTAKYKSSYSTNLAAVKEAYEQLDDFAAAIKSYTDGVNEALNFLQTTGNTTQAAAKTLDLIPNKSDLDLAGGEVDRCISILSANNSVLTSINNAKTALDNLADLKIPAGGKLAKDNVRLVQYQNRVEKAITAVNDLVKDAKANVEAVEEKVQNWMVPGNIDAEIDWADGKNNEKTILSDFNTQYFETVTDGNIGKLISTWVAEIVENTLRTEPAKAKKNYYALAITDSTINGKQAYLVVDTNYVAEKEQYLTFATDTLIPFTVGKEEALVVPLDENVNKYAFKLSAMVDNITTGDSILIDTYAPKVDGTTNNYTNVNGRVAYDKARVVIRTLGNGREVSVTTDFDATPDEAVYNTNIAFAMPPYAEFTEGDVFYVKSMLTKDDGAYRVVAYDGVYKKKTVKEDVFANVPATQWFVKKADNDTHTFTIANRDKNETIVSNDKIYVVDADKQIYTTAAKDTFQIVEIEGLQEDAHLGYKYLTETEQTLKSFVLTAKNYANPEAYYLAIGEDSSIIATANAEEAMTLVVKEPTTKDVKLNDESILTRAYQLVTTYDDKTCYLTEEDGMLLITTEANKNTLKLRRVNDNADEYEVIVNDGSNDAKFSINQEGEGVQVAMSEMTSYVFNLAEAVTEQYKNFENEGIKNVIISLNGDEASKVTSVRPFAVIKRTGMELKAATDNDFVLGLDTAYVNRGENYRYAYYITKPIDVEKVGSFDQKLYMVSYADSTDTEEVKYSQDGLVRIGFVPANRVEFGNNDSLAIAKVAPVATDTINVVKNMGITPATWAFAIDENDENAYRIESSTGKYVSYLNGILVLGNKEQAQLFNVTDTDLTPTDNEEISTSAVTVIAGNGQITIAGAAGKKVVVSNILGQVVANTVLTSDNATIAAPQGVVVVAVEGEEAVKAIVK